MTMPSENQKTADIAGGIAKALTIVVIAAGIALVVAMIVITL